MKFIKIIDLLNMIAEGRTPKKIKYDGEFYIFNKEKDNYYEDDESCSINWDYVVFHCLNESVEIIEEDNNKIERLIINEDYKFSSSTIKNFTMEDKRLLDSNFKTLSDKINEIIDKINNM